jgi:hypothetical protein
VLITLNDDTGVNECPLSQLQEKQDVYERKRSDGALKKERLREKLSSLADEIIPESDMDDENLQEQCVLRMRRLLVRYLAQLRAALQNTHAFCDTGYIAQLRAGSATKQNLINLSRSVTGPTKSSNMPRRNLTVLTC